MNTFDCKVSLLLAGYNEAHSDDELHRRELCHALFWLCERMKEDVLSNVTDESQTSHIETLHLMQSVIERGFMEPFAEEADSEFAGLLDNILGRVPDASLTDD
jgi:hypothetical protein